MMARRDVRPGEAGKDGSIDAVLSEVAARSPGAPALLCAGSAEVVYGDVERVGAQFASLLRANGVMRGDRVALLTGRSPSTILAIVGILKAGAAYVPLDADDPPDRLARMLDDCAPAVVLTQGGVKPVPAVTGRRVLDLDAALAAAADHDPAPPREASGQDPACVMYTSGSTGHPKGVLVPHAAILRLVQHQSYAAFGPDETILHLAPLAFDASSFEIWGALLNGGRLAIVSDPRPSLEVIADAVARHGVTTAWFTAGLFSLLVDHRLDALAPLRRILAGGDVLSPAHVRRAYAGLPGCTIVNGYGPTENATFTCCYPVPRDGWGDGPIPIGPAIAGTRVHLLGDDLAPVRPSEVGQICCGGQGLALGYMNQPRLTAEKFVTVDLGGPSRERVYLTGDLGRERPDGVVEFLGRSDNQVKIRGKRVEPGEVEDALRGDPSVADAVVVARNAPPDGKRLAAYMTLRQPDRGDGSRAATAALARLRTLLPDYMVPADAMVLRALPLTANGKVDRARLPAIEQDRSAPLRRPGRSSGLEDEVAAVWERVLSRPSVDRDANFFDLGGTSLLLMALHAELCATVAPKLPLVTLFEHTGVRSLTAFLERSGRGAAAPQPGRPPVRTGVPR